MFCAWVARSTTRFSLAKGNEAREREREEREKEGGEGAKERRRENDEEPSIVTALPGMHI